MDKSEESEGTQQELGSVCEAGSILASNSAEVTTVANFSSELETSTDSSGTQVIYVGTATNQLDDCQEGKTSEADDKSLSLLIEEASSVESEQNEKILLLVQLNSSLKLQVQSLLDVVGYLKKVNNCLDNFKEIALLYEAQNIQLKDEKQAFLQKVESLDGLIDRMIQDQLKQQNLIQGLQYVNMDLKAKIEAIQLDFAREEHLLETIRTLEQYIHDLQDVNRKIMLKSNEMEMSNKLLQNTLTELQKELMEKEKANKILQKQLEKHNADLRSLQGDYDTEEVEKDNSIKEPGALECTIYEKEMNIKHLENEKLNNELSSVGPKETSGDNVGTHLLSLSTELHQEKADGEAGKEQVEVKCAKPAVEEELLQAECENQQTEIKKPKSQIDNVSSGDMHLQELAAGDKEQKQSLRLEAENWKWQPDEKSPAQDEKTH
nr:PREDICTED: synaptonemal complex protein 1-like isoform X2 [Latimeria chalumnae]|eukprot:XP_014343383.1 PREDICTED: synaptonemal complex protein 1-like isoform X2 [Latimeria chalumnae]